MQLALLSGANPRTSRDGPTVMLSKGTWKITYDGVKDTVLWIMVTSKPFVRPDEDQVESFPIKHEHVLELPIASRVKLIFNQRGQERFVSVMAVKVS